jgi:hypothetical protein
MTLRPPRPKVSFGVVAGIISSGVVLILAYVAGVVAIAVSLRDFFATLLAAVTVLPLMLLVVFLLPNLLLGTTVGFLLSLGSRFLDRPLGVFAGALVGLALAEFVFSLAIPLIAPPQPSGNFITIASNRYLSGAYGLILGSLTGLAFRRLSRNG